jgi:hypothetical protein
MGNIKRELDKMWGGPFATYLDYIPGVRASPEQPVIYIQRDKSNDDHIVQASRMVRAALNCSVKKGALLGECCLITAPDQSAFYARSYWGDLDGWKIRLEEGAKRLGLLLAQIERERLVVSNGNEFKLIECEVFFNLTKKTDGPVRIIRWPQDDIEGNF